MKLNEEAEDRVNVLCTGCMSSISRPQELGPPDKCPNCGGTTFVASSDKVNHPLHYNAGDVEVIDFIKDMPFREGNVIKYIARYRLKGGVEDLKKARWYLNHLIEELEDEAT